MSPVFSPSEEHLQKMAPRIQYELIMLDLVFGYLQQEVAKDEKDRNNGMLNAMMESFLIHARLLHDFYYLDRPTRYPEDCFASDYTTEWSKQRPAAPFTTQSKEKMGYSLAHLSYKRIEMVEMNKRWDLADFKTIYQEISTARVAFITVLPTEKIAWF